MAYAALGKLKKNSPEATLTAGIDDTTGTIPVDHLEYFHDEDGTLIVKGIVLGPDTSTITETEEITITGASGTTGAGNLTGGTRGVNADGTVGAAKAWDSGTVIKVTYTTGIHNQIADNFAKIQTTAAMSVYVDKAATGTGDGTSWTDAFTTIQAAINSLPTVLEHAVTIYVRKGATAYSETLTINQISGKGSLIIRGEYYWTGECAAAGTSSVNGFRVTADDAANIAAGDYILVTDGYGANDNYTHYLYTTVDSVALVSGTTYEITTTDSADWGNIGAGDYYSVVKTAISGTTLISNTQAISIRGLHFDAQITVTNSSTVLDFASVIIVASTGYAVYVQNTSIVSYGKNCYFYGAGGGVIAIENSVVALNYGGGTTSTAYACVLRSGSASNGAMYAVRMSTILVRNSIIRGGGYGVYAAQMSYAQLSNGLIVYGTTNGAVAALNSGVNTAGTVYNKATTPVSPAGASDASYLW